MSLHPITIALPVGPNPAYKEYLPECLESLYSQTHLPHEVIIISDMAHYLDGMTFDYPNLRIVKNDWLCGCADSWNRGVALSQTELVFMMSSDDKLMPECLETCAEALVDHQYKSAWYSVTYQLQNGEVHDVPNNASMVTKKLWAFLGGFPPQAGLGAPDALCLSILMRNAPDRIIRVKQGTPLYWVRQHDQQDTRNSGPYFNGPIEFVRNIETLRWQQPEWTAEIK